MENNPFHIIDQRFDRLEVLIQKVLTSTSITKVTKEPETFDLPGLMEYLKLLGLPVKKSTIYKATMNRELKYAKFGRSLIFQRIDVHDWITKNIKSDFNTKIEEVRNQLAKEANNRLTK